MGEPTSRAVMRDVSPGGQIARKERAADTNLAATQMRRKGQAKPARRKPRGHGHERREEILMAAKELFVAHGFATVTTRQLAARVGISQTALYVYFRNKEEILAELSRRAFVGLVERIEQAAMETEVGPSRLRRLVEAYIEFGLEYPEEYQIVFMANPAGTPFGQPIDLNRALDQQPTGMDAFFAFREQFVLLSEAGFLRRMDVLVATEVMWMACHGLVALLIARPNFPWSDRDALIESIADTLVRGLQQT